MKANFALIALAVLTGWLALYPIRRRLGVWGYHGTAFLVGLPAWCVVVAITTAAGVPFGVGAAIAGHVAYAGALALGGWLLDRRDPARGDRPALAWWTWLVGGAVMFGAAAAHVLLGATDVAFDSYMHYDIAGIWLLDTGRIDLTIASGRNVFVPALHAGSRLLGAGWTYAVYPMLSCAALALLFGVLWAQAFRNRRPVARFALSAGLTVLLAILPGWVFHTYFVHSNMISAAYLTLALAGIGAASGFGGDRPDIGGWAWMVPAGIGAAGFALARPDGMAYFYVPLAVAMVVYLAHRIDLAEYATFVVTSLGLLVVVLLAEVAELGMWNAYKLDGKVVVALTAGAVVFWAAGVAARRWRPVDAWVSVGGNALKIAAVVNVVPVSMLIYLKREQFLTAMSNMLGNLMFHGGWGFLWYAVAAAVTLTLVFARVTGRSRWSWTLLYVFAQFMAVAVVVHGIAHEGRLSWMDSFNRVSLHILPVVFWYVGSFIGSLGDSYRDGDEVPLA